MREDWGSDHGQRPDAGPASWRRETLRSMLGVAAIVAPTSAVLAILGRPPPRPVLDSVVLLGVGLITPALRFAPLLSFATRAALTIGLLFGAGTFVLARTGLSPGATLLFAVASLLAALYFGRAARYVAIALGALAFVVVGWLVTRGIVSPPNDVFAAHRFGNWLRVGLIFALFATLLTSGVAFVIGRVEAGARDLRVAYERLGLLHLRLESAKEEERRSLARELHDEFGQLLTALKLRLQAGGRDAAAASGAHAGRDAVAVIDDLIARVRRMSGDLRPPLLDEVGLVPALRAYLDMQSTVSGVAMTLEVDEPPEGAPPLGRDVEITCFRVVQEAVTNAIRHAAARDLRVHVDRSADRLMLRVRDDGRGFDVDVRLEGAAAAGHLGVVGMRERVRAHGGGFRLSSRPGGGTLVEIELPLAPTARRTPVAVPS
jgi:signal transduction histidine kinase